ncbi:MAG: hypothetical protein CL916_01630, partial [Deltaproteobacteria bacterium]|nr:hypothetical protein [Deltaproteobacteria bacterium]
EPQQEEPVVRHADFSVHRLGTNIMKHTMVKIPPGSFRMGNHTTRLEGYSEPVHKVHITNPFWITSYPVVQVFYEKIMRQNPSHNQLSTYLPVENISWCEAVFFCNILSTREGLEPVYTLPSSIENTDDFSNQVRWNREANGYRLPTEAEWEYCARAGGTERYAGSNTLEDVGWYNKNASRTQEFGLKKPNNWNLYDMCGNVSEWVWDTPIRYYQDEILTYPVHVEPNAGKRIYRGGGVQSSHDECTASFRRFMPASQRDKDIGFRLVRNYDK